MTSIPLMNGRPWGPWTTAGLGLAVALVYVFIQVLTVIGFVAITGANDVPALLDDRGGSVLAVATLLSGTAGAALVLTLAGLRRGLPVRAYLALVMPSDSGMWRWVLGLVAFLLLAHGVLALFDRPFISAWEQELIATAGQPLLLWLAIVAVAPIFEELFFRGFLYAGLAGTRLGTSGAVVLTAALWAVVHQQYDGVEIGLIFVGGLLLGAARVRTASTLTGMALHGLWNLVSMTEATLLTS